MAMIMRPKPASDSRHRRRLTQVDDDWIRCRLEVLLSKKIQKDDDDTMQSKSGSPLSSPATTKTEETGLSSSPSSTWTLSPSTAGPFSENLSSLMSDPYRSSDSLLSVPQLCKSASTCSSSSSISSPSTTRSAITYTSSGSISSMNADSGELVKYKRSPRLFERLNLPPPSFQRKHPPRRIHPHRLRKQHSFHSSSSSRSLHEKAPSMGPMEFQDILIRLSICDDYYPTSTVVEQERRMPSSSNRCTT